ncbi:sigmaY antisigma factor component [uncultured Brevibacillus sp.]|uniref:sigmaY antisigma factor component n=1 Tax=uncultured Brevibacillus sp. TaxID=169970 RepID=UPI0025997B7B|nr:sigmaY antisigma factor component [uncultured Brevibacillus sp.]
MTQPHELPLWLLFTLLSLAAIQGTWLFLDAKKRSRFPWLWGLWGLTSIPTPLLVYLLVVRKVWKKGGV